MTQAHDTSSATDTIDDPVERIIPPEQPPMDDAAGGPTVHTEDDDVDASASGVTSADRGA